MSNFSQRLTLQQLKIKLFFEIKKYSNIKALIYETFIIVSLKYFSVNKPRIINNNRVPITFDNQMKFAMTLYSSQPSKNKGGSIRELNPDQYKVDDPYLLLNNPNTLIICSECYKNITIMCHVASQQYDYCVGCFANMDQFPETYSIRSTLVYTLTNPEWLCLDEILLLTAFEKWKYGNWQQVKDYMNFNGCKFNKNEIQEHYNEYYLSSEQQTPKIYEGILESINNIPGRSALRFKSLRQKKNIRKPLSMQELKSQEAIGHETKKIPQQNILGYNPKRKSFYYDLQYDQKAQAMLADLEFKDDDTPEQLQLKFKIIQNYNHRLDQRIKRYQFTIEHHILDIDYRFKQEFSANKYQKQAFLLYRPFTRFQTHEQNQQTLTLISNNNYYKSLIQGLKKCRKKIDKQGRIQQTLSFLKKKQDSVQKLGQPRKIFHIAKQPQMQDEGQLLRKIAQTLKQNQQGQSNHSLKIIYKSLQN